MTSFSRLKHIPCIFVCFILFLRQWITFVRINNNNDGGDSDSNVDGGNSNNVNIDVNAIDYISTLPTTIKATTSKDTLPNGDIVTTIATSAATTTKIVDVDVNDGSAIELLLPKNEAIWIRDRSKHFERWFQDARNITIITNKGQRKRKIEILLKPNADSTLPGPILDFLIVGSAKTGTTTLMDNLAQIAPMPLAKDMCYSPENILSAVYNDWQKKYNVSKIVVPSFNENDDDNNNSNNNSGGNNDEHQKQQQISLTGSKCPSLFGLPMLKRFSKSLPKTKFIIGIRHPITWFQSFWRMQGSHGPYERTQICPCPPHENPIRNNLFKNDTEIYDSLTRRCTIQDQNNNNKTFVVGCKNECGYKLFCTARARFHVSLARLGKTLLTQEERQLLAPNDIDGGILGLSSWNVTNDIFVYDQTQLSGNYLWEGLAKFLKVSKIPNKNKRFSHGKNIIKLDICDPMYDSFRAIMMKSSYEMSLWFEKYFIPVALDPTRTDIMIMNPDNTFLTIIQSYKLDPCERLIRRPRNDNTSVTDDDFDYILNPSFNTNIIPPPQNRKKYDFQIRTASDDDPSLKEKSTKKEKRRGRKGDDKK